MNEFYTADPDCLQSVGDLRYLFGLFGPQAGRYLAAYPQDWKQMVLFHFSHLPDIELERIKTLFRRAAEETVYLSNHSLPWVPDRQWVENALDVKKLTPRKIDEVISNGMLKDVLPFDELTLPTTADERIAANPDEYERVCRTLMTTSGELFLVDPYLSPCKRGMRPVLEKLLSRASKGKCQSVVCYGRASNVIGFRSFTWEEVVKEWRGLLAGIQWGPERQFRYVLVEDEAATCKMHGRYLFSLKGGIRLDQGFQRLPQGRTVDVSPVGKKVHDELISSYLEGKHDMVCLHEFAI